jgi:hypothetical protein
MEGETVLLRLDHFISMMHNRATPIRAIDEVMIVPEVQVFLGIGDLIISMDA